MWTKFCTHALRVVVQVLLNLQTNICGKSIVTLKLLYLKSLSTVNVADLTTLYLSAGRTTHFASYSPSSCTYLDVPTFITILLCFDQGWTDVCGVADIGRHASLQKNTEMKSRLHLQYGFESWWLCNIAFCYIRVKITTACLTPWRSKENKNCSLINFGNF